MARSSIHPGGIRGSRGFQAKSWSKEKTKQLEYFDMTQGQRRTNVSATAKINWKEIKKVEESLEFISKRMKLSMRRGSNSAMGITEKWLETHRNQGPFAGAYSKAKKKVAQSFILKESGSGSTYQIRFMSQDEYGLRGSGKHSSGQKFQLAHALNFGTMGQTDDNIQDKIEWGEYYKFSKKGAVVLDADTSGFEGSQKEGGLKVLPFSEVSTFAGVRESVTGYIPIPRLMWLELYSDIAQYKIAHESWKLMQASFSGTIQANGGWNAALAASDRDWKHSEFESIVKTGARNHPDSGPYLGGRKSTKMK